MAYYRDSFTFTLVSLALSLSLYIYIYGRISVETLSILLCQVFNSPSWEARSGLTVHNTSSLLRNPKGHSRVFKDPLVGPILSQFKSIHILTSLLFKV
jgi:hypothetical protein